MSFIRDVRNAVKAIASLGDSRGSIENPNEPVTSSMASGIVEGPPTSTGKSVSGDGAMRVSTILACIRVLAESVAQLPWFVYQRSGSAIRNKDEAHPVYELLHSRPNPMMSAFAFREQAVMDLVLHGNHYAEIEFDRDGYPVALWPLLSRNVEPVLFDRGVLKYRVGIGGMKYMLDSQRVLHVSILGNGVQGKGLIQYARETVGYALALDEYQGKFFANGANLSGYLKHPGKLSQEAKQRLKTHWEMAHSGLSNAHRVAVLEEGLDWVKSSVAPNEAQAIDARKLTRSELAGVLRVPAHFINDLEKATFSNVEHISIQFVVYDLLPWLVRFEQEYSYKLFKGERDRFCEFVVDGLMRGDALQRAQSLEIKRRNGVLTANEWRLLDNQNPIDNDYGDALLVPQHNAIVTKGGQILRYENPALESRRSCGNDHGGHVCRAPMDEESRAWEQRSEKHARRRRKLEKAFEPIFVDQIGKVVRRESAMVRDAMAKAEARDAGQFRALLDELYAEPQWIRDYVESAFRSLFDASLSQIAEELDNANTADPSLDTFRTEYIAAFVSRYQQRSLGQLRALLQRSMDEAVDYTDLIEERLDEWIERRPAKVADEETTRAANAVAQKLYTVSGILFLRWFANPGACPFCQNMHGRRIRVGSAFVPEGSTLDGPDGGMTVSHSVSHPPLHDGCECQLMGG